MNKRTVYLAGPIHDRDKSEAHDWRHLVAGALADHNIIGISPLRCEPLVGERYSATTTDPLFGQASTIFAKNLFDVKNCDMTLAYLPRPPDGRRQSWGTIMEIGWARILDRPVILVSDDPDVLAHPLLRHSAGWTLDNLDDAVEVAVGILGGYAGGRNV